MTDHHQPHETAFQQLLTLGRSLHSQPNGSVDPLSLRQLVPVYASLCQAVVPNADAYPLYSATPGGDKQVDFSNALLAVLATDDVSAFETIQNQGTDAERLLIIQFLLHHFPRMQGLAIVGIPYLLLPVAAEELQATTCDNDLLEAILDAVVSRKQDDNDNEPLWLSTVLSSCQTTLPTATACRILVRLQQQGYQHSVHTAIFELVLKGISDDTSYSSSSLQAVTSWLLPLLYNDASTVVVNIDQTFVLWTELFRKDDTIVVSAVLCTILPYLLETELPMVDAISATGIRKRPLFQPQLWDFIYSCIRPLDNMEIPKSAPGRGQDTKKASSTQTIRRRALYLLRILVENEHDAILWNTYVACFEIMEMETEPHLVDQVWDSVGVLCLAVNDTTNDLPPITWDWMSAMFCRLFLADTPVLRKLGCYRLLSGSAGIQVGPLEPEVVTKKPGMHMEPKKKKHSIKAKRTKTMGAPLSMISCDFVINALLPSYDTLGSSIGTNMQYEENGKIMNEDMIPKVSAFITAYVQALPSGERTIEFLTGIFSQNTVCQLRTKTALLVYRAVAQAVATRTDVVVDEAMILTAISSFGFLFTAGSVVVTFRQGLLEAFAQILSCCHSAKMVDPKTILKVLSLYPVEDTSFSKKNAEKVHPYLQTWLANMVGPSSQAVSTIGSACASTFVTGHLFSVANWDPRMGSSEMERAMGAAIVLLCSLTDSASSLLWPAIAKALSGMPCLPPVWQNAGKATRALILLEHGCRMELLSGLGNGDLVVDSKTQQMLPPPPNIDAMLANGVTFLLQHIKILTSANIGDTATPSGSTRSGNTSRLSNLLAGLISQLNVLHHSYPSSNTVSNASDELYKNSVIQLANTSGGIEVVTFTSLSFAALTCGANPLLQIDGTSTVNICTMLLRLDFTGNDTGMSKSDEQTARSMFHYSRWGALYCILPPFLANCALMEGRETLDLLDELFKVANNLVQATPVDALLPLFDCVSVAANVLFTTNSWSYSDNLERIISSLFDILSDASNSETSTYMLNSICELIFRPQLLIDEAKRLDRDCQYAAPIRAAFRRLMKMAGTLRSNISKAVLCRVCGAWLGFETLEESNTGVGAIPYREDLVQLLVQKDSLIDESSTNQSILQSGNTVPTGAVGLPQQTGESSVSRAFVLVFLSRLPNPDDGINDQVTSELLHYLVIRLLDDICLAPLKGGAMIMTGSEDYSLRIRAWQALCVLSRFVSGAIAEQVCNKVFMCMSQNLHGQIRYFLEVFTMQCARQHPPVFVKQLVVDIRRYDLSLQHVSSLMIVSGNLIIGQHRLDFFSQFVDDTETRRLLKEVLVGVIPWLSSTQGFSRCIAQLLVYELIPRLVDVNTQPVDENEWYLRSLFAFLQNNSDMKRLRTKQTKFFDSYNIDRACTPEGLMTIDEDESNEANPVHMIDAIKRCLESIYLEAREDDAPMWKQIEEMTLAEDVKLSPPEQGVGIVNFQRKIIPLDSLGLALGESRDKQLRNASGRLRQQLIVCASLIDKVPNLAGLARTAEIFAAERLVIPDISICKMDNFKSISVGAGEWIKIEECKEDVSSNE